MKSTLIICWFTVSMILTISCTKETSPVYNPIDLDISEKLLPMLFDTSSYWIYQNPDSSQFDSISIQEITEEIFQIPPSGPGDGSPGIYRYYNVFYSSSLTGPYQEQFILHYITRDIVYSSYVYISGHSIGDKMENATVSDILDTLRINDFTYHDIVTMALEKDKELPFDMNLFYVDSVGVIRKEIIENSLITETWDLVRYEVELYDTK